MTQFSWHETTGPLAIENKRSKQHQSNGGLMAGKNEAKLKPDAESNRKMKSCGNSGMSSSTVCSTIWVRFSISRNTALPKIGVRHRQSFILLRRAMCSTGPISYNQSTILLMLANRFNMEGDSTISSICLSQILQNERKHKPSVW